MSGEVRVWRERRTPAFRVRVPVFPKHLCKNASGVHVCKCVREMYVCRQLLAGSIFLRCPSLSFSLSLSLSRRHLNSFRLCHPVDILCLSLSFFLSLCLSVCLSVCLSLCLKAMQVQETTAATAASCTTKELASGAKKECKDSDGGGVLPRRAATTPSWRRRDRCRNEGKKTEDSGNECSSCNSQSDAEKWLRYNGKQSRSAERQSRERAILATTRRST